MMAQSFDSTLQMDATRAFNEHDIAGPQVFYQPLAGGIGVAKKDRGNAARACCGGQVFRVALDSNDKIEASLRGGATTSDVKRGALAAQFEHLAGHENAASCGGARGEGSDHGAERFGVGVVAVIQNRGSADLDDLAALIAGSE